MKEFLLVFRNEALDGPPPSPEKMQATMKLWQDWMGSIAAQNKLASSGARLGFDGKTVRPGQIVTNGPYVEIKEALAGFIIVKAESLEDAAELARGCPILNVGGNVEVRYMMTMEDLK